MTDLLERLRTALVGRYAIERLLGVGGMAQVYLARDVQNDRRVALKVLLPEIAQAIGTDRFLEERHLAANLQHPHVLELFDSGEADGLLYYAMPYLTEESLRARVDREGRVPIEDAVQIAKEVADGLGYLHANGIVHRDIKPDNILFKGGHAVIADFGIARVVSDAEGGKTLPGFAVGTPEYMSPEQATAQPHVDGRTDVYALGCVLYEMLVGRTPYQGSTVSEVIAGHLSKPVPEVRDRNAAVPADVAAVVAEALKKDPAKRFQSAQEMLEALTAPMALDKVVRAFLRGMLWQTTAGRLAVSAVVLVLLAVVGYGLWPRGPEVDPNRVAIAPFEVLEGVPPQWGTEVQALLEQTLSGVGRLVTEEREVVSQAWLGSGVAGAERVARAVQAGLVVFGQAAPVGTDSVRVSATVYDAAAESTEPVEVVGTRTELARTADAVAVGVLEALSRTRGFAGQRRHTFGSEDPRAIRAFLQAEIAHVVSQKQDSALYYYTNALELDTTFALAYRQAARILGGITGGVALSAAGGPQVTPGPRDSLAYRAAFFNRGLESRDSLLIVVDSLWYAEGNLGAGAVRIFWGPPTHESEQLWRRARELLFGLSRRYPEDLEVWKTVFEWRLHMAPWIPTSRREVLDAMTRLTTGAGDSLLIYPGHEGEVVNWLHGPVRFRALLEEAARRDSGNEADLLKAQLRLLDPAFLHTPQGQLWLDSLDRAACEAEVDPGDARVWRQWGHTVGGRLRAGLMFVLPFWATGVYAHGWPDSAETGLMLGRRPSCYRDETTLLPWHLSARGHLDEAVEAFRGLESGGYETYPLVLRPIEILPAYAWLDLWTGMVTPEVFASASDSLEAWIERGGAYGDLYDYMMQRAWFTQGDSAQLLRSAELWEQNERQAAADPNHRGSYLFESTWRPWASYPLAAARGYLALLRGDTATAIEHLSRYEPACPRWCTDTQMVLAGVLAARGRLEEASDLYARRLYWTTVWPYPPGLHDVVNALLHARVLKRMVDQGTGQARQDAIDTYRWVRDMWQGGDAAVQPYVEEANAALEELGWRG